MHLKISRNAQENTCARVFFILIKSQRNWHKCFPVNFARRFLRAPFTEHLWTTASVFIDKFIHLLFFTFFVTTVPYE